MSLLDDAADNTKDAIKEAQRRKQGVEGVSDDPDSNMPLSDIADEVQNTVSGKHSIPDPGHPDQGLADYGDEHLGAEGNEFLAHPDSIADGDEWERQPRFDERDPGEELDRPGKPVEIDDPEVGGE